MKTIVLDPGHGGYDSGAVSGARLEKNDNLRLAQAVRDRLVAAGQRVVMTRTGDTYVSLIDRSNIANRANADIFVSLHRNDAASTSANGVENWVQVGSPPVNTRYAQTVLNSVLTVGCLVNRGVREGNFSVLRNTDAPAQLLEMGFIGNAHDNACFDAHFNEYADAIARGILTALGEPFEPGTPPPPPTGDPIIRSIQNTLNQRYGASLSLDGVYGIATRAALIRGLQTELNREFNARLTVDGIFGPATRAAVRTVRRGDRGNRVFLLQALLYVNGYKLEPDGVFGPATEQAVMQFQRDRGLTVDGLAGPATFTALIA